MSCNHNILDCKFCPECGIPIVKTNDITVNDITFTNVKTNIELIEKNDSTNVKPIDEKTVEEKEEKKINIEIIKEICGEDTVRAIELKYNNDFFEIYENYYDKHGVNERQIVIKCLYSQNDVLSIKNMIIKKLEKSYLLTDETILEECLKKTLYEFFINVEVDEERKYADELNKILDDITDDIEYFDIEDASWCAKLLNQIIIKNIQIPKKEYILYNNNKFVALKYDDLNKIINDDISVLCHPFHLSDKIHILLYPDEDVLEDLKESFEKVKDINADLCLECRENILRIRHSIIDLIKKHIDYQSEQDIILKSLKDIINSIDITKLD